jgi:radical SAM protein with 4Fe4S-binding SPASM domain
MTTDPNKALCHLTYKCNGNCTHCYIAYEYYKPQGEMTLKQWCKALELLGDYGITKPILLGGETTILPYISRLVRAAMDTSAFAQIDIQTNGFVVNEELVKTLHHYYSNSTKIGFNVSIEDMDNAFNTAIRGNDSLAAARKAAYYYSTEGFPVTIRSTIFQQNDVLGVMRFANEIGASFAAVPFLPTGTYGEKLKSLQPTAVRLTRLYREFKDLKDELGMSASIEQSQYYLYDEDLHKAAKKTFEENGRACPAGNKEISLDPFSNVYACQMAMDKEKYPEFFLGNLRTHEWEEIMGNKEEFNQWREELPLLDHCEDCALKKQCGGACTLHAAKLDWKAKGDPECPIELMRLSEEGDKKLEVALATVETKGGE